MELIVSEKNNVARRIAGILSDGSASVSRVNGVNTYQWENRTVIGLSGHVVSVDFPDEYSNWNKVDPKALIDAEIVKTVIKPDIVNALQRLSTDADTVTIATDYDREGELIGKEAYDLVGEVNPELPVRRVRFSSITEKEVIDAFKNQTDIDFDLAEAGEARQIIDLIWGAALTRVLSLAAKQYGEDFISVGRVQSPTLKLIVDREREIEAFDPDDYWELLAVLRKDDATFETQYFYLDAEDNEADRIWNQTEANAVFKALDGTATATVREVERHTRTDRPPAPFNTTQFIRAAGAIGLSAKRSMSIAESLYTAGYITYPRTDNTVYPSSLDPASLLRVFAQSKHFRDDAQSLLGGNLKPTRGQSQTTDHPPIHPTGDLPSGLSNQEWRVYELVVRRFFATLADPAVWEHLRVVANATGLALKANGKRLVDPGYHAVYPYFKTDENIVPAVEEDEALSIDEVRLEEKQTQPPRRYGQSRLIETMEQMGVGTKSTRHNTIDKLYDRGYVEGDPPRPTQLARGVIEAASEYANLVVSESMTAELEDDMAAIASGEKTLESVTAESRQMLERVFDELEPSKAEIGRYIREKLKADNAIGECPECGKQLLVRKNRYGGHFVGCDGYPTCEYTLPLPKKGNPVIRDDVCPEHGFHEVKMLAGRGSFVHGCPLCKANEAESEEDLVIGSCPDCGVQSGGELAVKRVRSGSRLVGCTRYPDCEYSLPLPRRGDLEIAEDVCAEHDLPEIVIHSGDDPWELGCPICNYESYVSREGSETNGIQAIRGIGKRTAEKLAAVGVETVDDLKSIDSDQLAGSVRGVSSRQIEDWKAKA